MGNNPVRYVDPDGREDYIVGSQKEDWEFDRFGLEILFNYLYGNGKDMVRENEAWNAYMKNNASLTNQIKKQLNKYLYDTVGMKPGTIKDFSLTMHGEVENGESITGYNYMHGSNSSVGDLEIKGTALAYEDGTIRVVYSATWNDVMDPNPQYETDIKKAAFAKIISFGRAKDFVFRVKWWDNLILTKQMEEE